jgi:hypothetical protein
MRIDADQRNPTKSATGDAKESVKKTHFLSLYPKIFDYSLGGYYHRERWARTQRYYKKIIYYLMIKGATIYLSLYSKTRFLTIASRATPIGSADRAPDEILTYMKEVEKAKEDLESAITTIGREYIYSKTRLNNPKIFGTEIVKQGCNV